MKKIAIIKLGTLEIKMNIASILPNQTFIMLDEYREQTKIVEDFENDVPISKTRLNEILATFNNFKAICQSKKVDEVYCFAEYAYKNLKNEHSFFEQLSSKTGYRFVILGYKENIDYIYTAVVSSINITKGVFINIEESKTYIVQYNRRMVVNQIILPFGYANHLSQLKDYDSNERFEYINSRIKEILHSYEGDWLKNLSQDTITVLQGDIFKNISRLVRKKIRYPFDKDQNFTTNRNDVINACNDLIAMPFESNKKLKGTTFRADAMVIGAIIAKSILTILPYFEAEFVSSEEKNVNQSMQATDTEYAEDTFEKETESEETKSIEELVICEHGLAHGLLFKNINDNNTLPYKPLDILDFSLSSISYYYNPESNTEYVSKLSCMIFKQLRVLHKLNRYYLTVLKIASKLYNSGERINPLEIDKYGYHCLINSPIFGVKHREILLAGFVLMFQNNDNFALTEWAKYKPLIVQDGEDEAEIKLACQRLAVILKLARAFDKYSNSRITDIECDNLGECVIMKTSMAINSSLEIREARKLDTEFKRVFNNKKIEIL